jgi:hypothetical protein
MAAARWVLPAPLGPVGGEIQSCLVSLFKCVLTVGFVSLAQRIQLFKGILIQASQTAICQQAFFPVCTGFGLGTLAGDYPAEIRYPFG